MVREPSHDAALPPRRLSRVLAACLPPLLLGPACKSAEEHRDEADEEVYAILAERRRELFDEESPFTIEPPDDSLRQRLLRGEVPAVTELALIDCLEIAAENSREVRRRKESLYRVALDLTLERFRFESQGFAVVGASAGGVGGNESASVDADAGLTRLLGNGALIVADLGASMFRTISLSDGWDSITDVGLSITQPLLRSSGARVVQEPLTQAERDVVYEVRSFERFRRTFAVDVAERYYGVLRQADTLRNQEENYTNLVLIRERNEALAEAGRLSDIEVDQARQDELRSRNRLIDEMAVLEALVDAFNLFLGLPVGTPLELDGSELERLATEEPVDLDVDAGALVTLALAERLDLRTARDEVEDSLRRTVVAADALRAGLFLSGSVAAASEEGRPLDYTRDGVAWDASLVLQLPIDRLPERNAYRAALIDWEAARRFVDELGDSIVADVRDALRLVETNLEGARIQARSVQLAERRVESARLNLDAGRATTRDLLEAQEDLLDAQNGLTAALIDYHLSLLALYRDLEVLRVDEGGIGVEATLLAPALEGGP